MKKIISIMLSISLAITIFILIPNNVNAIEKWAAEAGNNCSYKYDYQKNLLTIYGEGRMFDYNYSDNGTIAPWLKNNMYSGMKRVVFEEGIDHIGRESFWNRADYMCGKIEELDIASSVTSIGVSAFERCSNLKEVNLPSDLVSIDESAFRGCSGLEEVNMPEELSVISKMAFSGCTSIRKLRITGECIYPYSFASCTALESVTFSKNVGYIRENIFLGDTNLSEIYFEGKAPSTFNFNEKAFAGITATVYYPADDFSWINVINNPYGGNITWVPMHTLSQVTQIEPTCTTYGVKEYYKCDVCNKYYEDEKSTKEIIDLDAWKTGDGKIAKTGHKYATEWTSDGTNHWHECTECGKKKDSAAHTLKTATITKATLTENGKKETKCTVCGKVTKTETIYAAKTIKLSKTIYTYDGKAKKPTVTIKDSKDKAIATTNYTVKYDDGRKNVGNYNVKITFKGDYKGSKALTFTINPKATTLKSVTPASKAFTATWTKQTTQVDGYEIQYALDKNFTSSAKKVVVTKNTTTSKKISSLKSKKTYYVRVRTYKKVGTKKYYSDWSKILNVKTK